MKKAEVKLNHTIDAEAVSQLLSDLANSIREGKIVLENQKEYVALEISDGTEFEIELQAGKKKNKQRFRLDLSWRTMAPKIEETGTFKISSNEPEIIEPSPDEVQVEVSE